MKVMSMSFVVLLCMVSLVTKAATPTMKMYFKNTEISKVIEAYSAESEKSFIVDPRVKGKISIFNQKKVSLDEAFNQLSTGLALNGFAILKQGKTLVVQPVRSAQRSLVEVGTERPSLKPERLYTWIAQLKYLSVRDLQKSLRILPSKDGEMSAYASTNQLVITDFVSNIIRVADIVEKLDIPQTSKTHSIKVKKKNK